MSRLPMHFRSLSACFHLFAAGEGLCGSSRLSRSWSTPGSPMRPAKGCVQENVYSIVYYIIHFIACCLGYYIVYYAVV